MNHETRKTAAIPVVKWKRKETVSAGAVVVKEFVLGFSKFVTRTFEFRVVSPIVFCDGVPDTGLFALPFSSCFFSGFDNGTAVKKLWW